MFDALTKFRQFNSIRYRIMLYLLAFGLLIAFVLSAIETYFNYQNSLDSVYQQFEQIQDSFIDGISNSLWSLNTNLTQIQLEGIQALPNISYAGIESNGSLYAEAGSNPNSTQLILNEYALTYNYGNQLQTLGSLTVIADTSTIQANAVASLGNVLLFESISVALIVFLVSILMNQMILKHVIKISLFMREIAQESVLPTLQLDRSHKSILGKNDGNNFDELDVLVNAFNYMKDEREKANTALLFSEEKFSKAFHSSPQILIISSQIDGIPSRDYFGN